MPASFRHTASRRLIAIVMAMCALAFSQALAKPNVLSDRLNTATDAQLDDERPATLAPQSSASEEEADHSQALALFAAARMKEQKEEFADALRLYQRALRSDPRALAAARQIVPLAFTLGRPAEAVRYALKAAELDASDPVLLRRLAVHLTTQGEFEQALALYDKVAKLDAGKPLSTDQAVIAAQMAKLYVVTGKQREAADCYRVVLKALDDPSGKVLDGRTRKVVVEDVAKTLDLLGATVDGRSAEANAYDMIGTVLLEAEDIAGARAAFEKASQASPHEGLDALRQAQTLAKERNWPAALERTEKCLAAKPAIKGTSQYELLAKLLEELGQKEQLLPRLEKLHAENPADVTRAYFLAERYRQAGQLDKAEPLFIQALAAQPSVLGYRALIDIHRRNQAIEPLLKVYLDALAQLRSIDALGEEGQALVADRESVGRLLASAREQAERGALDPQALTAVAQLALDVDLIDDASRFFGLAVDHGGEGRALVARRWGLGLLLKDRYDDAAKVFRRAIDDKFAGDAAAEFYYHLAGALEMAGHTDQALVAANKARDLAEEKPAELGDSYYRIVARPAWVLYHAKQRDKSEAEYKQLIGRFDKVRDSDPAREAIREARLMLSNIAVAENRLPECEEWLEQILDEFPDDVSASNDLGYLWIDQGKHLKRGLAMIEKAVAAEPENGAYLDSLGWALYRLNRFDEALQRCEKAVSLEKNPDGVMLDHLGDAAKAAGQLDKARAAWGRAQQAFEKAGEPAKVKAVKAKLAEAAGA